VVSQDIISTNLVSSTFRLFISSAAFLKASKFLAIIQTFPPNRTISLAVAFPIPLEPPQTIAVFPLKGYFLINFSLVILILLSLYRNSRIQFNL
jgi:hypothetical protein